MYGKPLYFIFIGCKALVVAEGQQLQTHILAKPAFETFN